MMNCGALIVVPFLLREDAKFLFDDGTQSNMQPRLFCDRLVDSLQYLNLKNILDGDASYKVFIEKHFISEVKDFVQSVVILAALHYVFNVAYSAKLNSFYTFLQRSVLEINDRSNCPTKILNLISRLKSDNLI